MARRNDAGRYLLEGLTPEQIAGRMGISLVSVCQYLCTLVGEGKLQHADIAFNIAQRHLIEAAIRNGTDAYRILDEHGHRISRDLIDLYLLTRDPRSDLYALICEIEVLLHRLVKQTLTAAYGNGWWREGIPELTRKNCQLRKEEDKTPLDDPYRYTTFIELKLIIEKNWSVFSIALPKPLSANKPNTLQMLQNLNGIRNQIMHPVKEIIEYESNYRFARKFLADFDHLRWRIDHVRPTF